MNRKAFLIASMVVVVLLLTIIIPVTAQNSTATPSPSTPQPTTPPMTASTAFFATADFRVNVRSGPGTQYTVIGQLRRGDALDITGRLANNRWLRVNFNGQEGWVSAALVTVTGDVATAPEAQAGPNAVLRQNVSQSGNTPSGVVTVVTRVNANLRATPAVNGTVLDTIPFSTELTVTGRTATSNWVQVTFNNQTGWVSSGVLFFSRGNIDNVIVLDENGNPVPAQATSQPAAQPTPEATP